MRSDSEPLASGRLGTAGGATGTQGAPPQAPQAHAQPVGAAAGSAAAGAAAGATLSAFDIGCVVVGGIVGVGIFFTPAKVAERAGSAGEVMLAWSIGGVLAVLGALVFAELSARVPGHGGIFRYVHAAFGRLPAFLYGWSNWLVIQAGALGVVALLCIEHVERALFAAPVLAPGARVAVAVLAILLFTLTNLVGLQVGKRVQNALTVTNVEAANDSLTIATNGAFTRSRCS